MPGLIKHLGANGSVVALTSVPWVWTQVSLELSVQHMGVSSSTQYLQPLLRVLSPNLKEPLANAKHRGLKQPLTSCCNVELRVVKLKSGSFLRQGVRA